MTRALDAIDEALSLAIGLRDPATGTHCVMVGELAEQTARALGLRASDRRIVRLAGRLHDLGKVGVPDRILRNTDELDPRELAIVQAHAANGERIVTALGPLDPSIGRLARAVGAHHERWDGSGYPDGLAGEAIPKLARILAVADAYSALVMRRSYDPARPHEDVVAIIERGAGRLFDPQVVEAFLALWRHEPPPAAATPREIGVISRGR